jgi:uncharacterized sulfatase
VLRHFLILLSALVAVTAFAKKPNIVLILSDDQAWMDYSFMDHKYIQTPHIDKLASEGVLFRRGYVPTALCRPSLMTLATGHYVHKHGVTGNDPSPAHYDRNAPIYNEKRAELIAKIDKFDTLPELLVNAGYLTHQSGKWWEGNFKRGGFTHGMTRGFPEKGGRHGDDGLKIGRKGMAPIDKFMDEAIEQKKPFFLWYAPFLPHTPHNPPKRLFDKYLAHNELPKFVARYYAMCEWFDETCGELAGLVEAKGQTNNTLFVYVCDNGWIQSPDSGKYYKRSKQTPYEGGVRSPMFYTWKGKLQPQDRSELSSSIDIFPTILAAAGIKPPEDRPGLNLWPHITKKTPITRDHIMGESFAHDIKDVNDPTESLLFRWCIQDNWKLLLTYDGEVNRYKSTHPRTEKRPQLFDLAADPHEKKNLAAKHPQVVRAMAKRITDWYPVGDRKTVTTWSE